MQQLDLVPIPKQRGNTPRPIAAITSHQIVAYVRHALQEFPARQAERERRRRANRLPKTDKVAMPTLFDMEPTETE